VAFGPDAMAVATGFGLLGVVVVLLLTVMAVRLLSR
jgi:hypothetical protein